MKSKTGRTASVVVLMIMFGICHSSPISTTLFPVASKPTSMTIQKSINIASIEPKLDRTGWEPIVMHLLPSDSYFPQSKVTQAPPTTTPEPEVTTSTTTTTTTPAPIPTEESDQQNDVELDGQSSLQSASYASRQGGSWTPVAPFYEGRSDQPAYYPAPSLYGTSVNGYRPPAVSYADFSTSKDEGEEVPSSHYSSAFPSPVRAAVGYKVASPEYANVPQEYGLPAEYGVPSKAPEVQQEYGLPSKAAERPEEYDLPSKAPVLQEEYGLPSKAPIQQEYGVPSQAPSQEYGIPSKSQEYGAPTQEYGIPSKSQEYGAPTQEYGIPSKSQEYGVPSQEYGTPLLKGYTSSPSIGYGTPVAKTPGLEYGVPVGKQVVEYGSSPNQAYGYPVYAPAAYVKEVPVVKKVHVKHENLIHRHNHHKHILHEHHLHKLHVHNHHLHRFHVHNHHKNIENIHVPITHVHEKHQVKETSEVIPKQTIGETHKHVHQVSESYRTAAPMYIVNPHQHSYVPKWTPWG